MNAIAKIISAAALALGLTGAAAQAADKPTLNVLTYSGFSGKYGPGPEIKKGFEAVCGCTLDYTSLEDAGTLVARLQLEGAATKADVLLGIDQNLMGEAKATGLFAAASPGVAGLSLPVEWKDDTFLPFDYGWFAFVYDTAKLKTPPASLKALVDAPDSLKIVIQDPRTSTPGLGLLLWTQSVFGDGAPAAWTKLKPKIVTVTKGWSEAYDLFLKGEADMVLSYTTSPAYHLIAEKKDNYAAASFSEGHYLQIEVAAALKASKQPVLAKQFLAFLVSPQAQAALPETQWMYPVKTPAGGLPAGFEKMITPVKSLNFDSAEIAKNRKAWIDAWLAATAK